MPTRSLSRGTCCLAALLALASILPAQVAGPAAVDLPRLTSAFAGAWTGKLEYRDFQSNQRVSLPTLLSAHASADGRELTLAYTYDDGPGKTVRETEMLTLYPRTGTATLMSGGDHATVSYTVVGLDDFARFGAGILILAGKGTENDKPVDTRITITLTGISLTWLKETRPSGSTGAFAFRDAYTLTRTSLPAAS